MCFFVWDSHQIEEKISNDFHRNSTIDTEIFFLLAEQTNFSFQLKQATESKNKAGRQMDDINHDVTQLSFALHDVSDFEKWKAPFTIGASFLPSFFLLSYSLFSIQCTWWWYLMPRVVSLFCLLPLLWMLVNVKIVWTANGHVNKVSNFKSDFDVLFVSHFELSHFIFFPPSLSFSPSFSATSNWQTNNE